MIGDWKDILRLFVDQVYITGLVIALLMLGFLIIKPGFYCSENQLIKCWFSLYRSSQSLQINLPWYSQSFLQVLPIFTSVYYEFTVNVCLPAFCLLCLNYYALWKDSKNCQIIVIKLQKNVFFFTYFNIFKDCLTPKHIKIFNTLR